jgi:hypothetical protein
VTRTEAHSAAVDQADGAATAHLAVFALMQSDLDAMLQWQQKLAPAVSDRGWDVSTADLQALGVVLRPTALARVEQASQQLNLIFPPGSGEHDRNQSRAAHVAYRTDRGDLQRADDIVRCAEIYLDEQVHPDLHLVGSEPRLDTCTAEFGVNSPTSQPARSVSIYLLKRKRSGSK